MWGGVGHRGNPSGGPGRKAQDEGGKLGAPLPNRKSLGAERAEGEGAGLNSVVEANVGSSRKPEGTLCRELVGP